MSQTAHANTHTPPRPNTRKCTQSAVCTHARRHRTESVFTHTRAKLTVPTRAQVTAFCDGLGLAAGDAVPPHALALLLRKIAGAKAPPHARARTRTRAHTNLYLQ